MDETGGGRSESVVGWTMGQALPTNSDTINESTKVYIIIVSSSSWCSRVSTRRRVPLRVARAGRWREDRILARRNNNDYETEKKATTNKSCFSIGCNGMFERLTKNQPKRRLRRQRWWLWFRQRKQRILNWKGDNNRNKHRNIMMLSILFSVVYLFIS